MSSIASDNQSIRWQWLDSAKGIAIFAVMMQHGAHFVLASDDIFASLVIDTFFMPLFFLCSGFVCVKLLNRSVEHKWGIVLKDFSLLLPFVLCGIAYGYCITGRLTISGILMRLLSTWSIGYWFLFVLFLFRIAVIFSDILLSACNIGRYKIGVIVLSLVVALIFGRLTDRWEFTVAYFPFFLLGIVMRKYSLHTRILQYQWGTTILALLAVLSFVLYHYLGYSIHPVFHTFVVRGLVTLSLFLACFHSGGNALLATIGSYSLDIYCLHYFFIVGCHKVLVPEGFLLSYPWAVQTLMMFVVASLLTMASITLSRCISAVPNLHKFIFGR